MKADCYDCEYRGNVPIPFSEFNKTVFLTREEAEKALEGGKNELETKER